MIRWMNDSMDGMIKSKIKSINVLNTDNYLMHSMDNEVMCLVMVRERSSPNIYKGQKSLRT